MVAVGTGLRFEEIARDLFGVVTHLCLTVSRGRRRPGDLKESEFLTLAILHERGTMIVGDIQRLLGVLPAQMSRIVRALEGRERPLIHCRINSRDKRKVDVVLTAAGEKALVEFQTARVARLAERLRSLENGDLDDLIHLGGKLHALLDRQAENEPG